MFYLEIFRWKCWNFTAAVILLQLINVYLTDSCLHTEYEA